VKELESLGIGRPSTYASIIQTIQDREYVMQQERRFYASMLGSIVTDKLIQAFPDIMNVQFTAGMELKLDEVEEQHLDWIKLLQDFYGPFHAVVDGALEKIEHAGGSAAPYKCPKAGNPMPPKPKPITTTIACPTCGSPLYLRGGKRGPWLGCSKYPKCRGRAAMSKLSPEDLKQVEALIPLLKEEGAKAQEMVAKIIGANPAAPGAKPLNNIPTDIDCDECGKPMVIRQGRRGPFLACSGYPKCKNTDEVPA